jgi:prepilin-type N-terminal cleavage/methylation domain-containing protein
MNSHRGFTLLELLIVIAIILILIAIALPNFLEVQVRAKSVRAQGEMRSLHQALQSYYLDFGFFPLRTRNQSLPPETPSGLQNLSTPIPYLIQAHLEDPFPEPPYYTHYRYWPVKPDGYVQASNPTAHNKDSNWYMLSSNGPENNFTPFADAMRGQASVPFADSVYMPTNGTRSEGNIWRVGGAVDGVARYTVIPVLPVWSTN